MVDIIIAIGVQGYPLWEIHSRASGLEEIVEPFHTAPW
jgi:hypothetical protein